MKYYYRTTEEGFALIFQTECISPSEAGVIRLVDTCRGAGHMVEIDSSLLLSRHLKEVAPGVVEYSLPVFLVRGKVRFIFSSEDARKNFEASSVLMLAIKCVSKYKDAIVVSGVYDDGGPVEPDCLPREAVAISHVIERRFDIIKGAIISYVCASCSSSSTEGMDLKAVVRGLKNDIAGLHTRIMMDSRSALDVEEYLARIDQAKTRYVEYRFRETNLFDILRQLFKNMVEIVAEKNASDSNAPLRSSGEEYQSVVDAIEQLEDKYRIQEKRAELKKIKNREAENGRRKGKEREYFKKGTPERACKEALAAELERFESSDEYNRLLREKIRLEGIMKPEGHESVIRALFERMSDVTTSLLEAVDSSSASGSADMSQLECAGSRLRLREGAFDRIEMAFFNIVLAHVVANPVDVSSEQALMNLINDSAKAFKNTEAGKSEKGEAILNCLREFWKYKQHKTFSFSIPEDMPVFGPTMAFFVKPSGSEQLNRYMQNRRFSHKKFGFMLWGACVGYSGLPKTFTNDLYGNDELTDSTDAFLEALVPQILSEAEQTIPIGF